MFEAQFEGAYADAVGRVALLDTEPAHLRSLLQFKKREPQNETSRSHLASSSSATSESSVTPMSIDGDHVPPEANGYQVGPNHCQKRS